MNSNTEISGGEYNNIDGYSDTLEDGDGSSPSSSSKIQYKSEQVLPILKRVKVKISEGNISSLLELDRIIRYSPIFSILRSNLSFDLYKKLLTKCVLEEKKLLDEVSTMGQQPKDIILVLHGRLVEIEYTDQLRGLKEDLKASLNSNNTKGFFLETDRKPTVKKLALRKSEFQAQIDMNTLSTNEDYLKLLISKIYSNRVFKRFINHFETNIDPLSFIDDQNGIRVKTKQTTDIIIGSPDTYLLTFPLHTYLKIIRNIGDIERTRTYIKSMAKIPVLYNAPQTQITELAYYLSEEKYNYKAVVFDYGESTDDLFLVKEGTFELKQRVELKEPVRGKWSKETVGPLAFQEKLPFLHYFDLTVGNFQNWELIGDYEIYEKMSKRITRLVCMKQGGIILRLSRREFLSAINEKSTLHGLRVQHNSKKKIYSEQLANAIEIQMKTNKKNTTSEILEKIGKEKNHTKMDKLSQSEKDKSENDYDRKQIKKIFEQSITPDCFIPKKKEHQMKPKKKLLTMEDFYQPTQSLSETDKKPQNNLNDSSSSSEDNTDMFFEGGYHNSKKSEFFSIQPLFIKEFKESVKRYNKKKINSTHPLSANPNKYTTTQPIHRSILESSSKDIPSSSYPIDQKKNSIREMYKKDKERKEQAKQKKELVSRIMGVIGDFDQKHSSNKANLISKRKTISKQPMNTESITKQTNRNISSSYSNNRSIRLKTIVYKSSLDRDTNHHIYTHLNSIIKKTRDHSTTPLPYKQREYTTPLTVEVSSSVDRCAVCITTNDKRKGLMKNELHTSLHTRTLR